MRQLIKCDLTKDLGILIGDRFYTGQEKFPFHYDRHSRISIVISGVVREVVHQHESFGKAMSIVVKPSDARHSNEFHPKGARIISIGWNPNSSPDFLNITHLENYKWYHDTSQAAAAAQLLQELHQSNNAIELQSNIINFIANLDTIYHNSHHKNPPQWLQHIAERLEDECAKQLFVQDLAKEVGVHPVYLARIFRRFYACSIKDFLQKSRVRQAIHHLASTEEALAHIAFDAGFADQSHLNRLFKREMDISPGQFRKLTQKVSFVQD